jgi:WD40 repeat protein
MSFTGDGKQLVMLNAVTSDVFRVDVQTGASSGAFKLDPPYRLDPEINFNNIVSFSLDGKRMLMKDGIDAQLYDAENGKKIRDYKWALGEPSLRIVALSPDGKTIIRGGDNGLVRVMTADNGTDEAKPVEIGAHPAPDPAKKILILRGHTEIVKSIDYSADGKRIISASPEDKTIRLWDAATGELLKSYDLAARYVRILRDGKQALIIVKAGESSYDTQCALLNLETGKRSATFGTGRTEEPLESDLYSMAQLPDGRFVAASQQGLSFWKANGAFEKLIGMKPELHRISSGANVLIVSPDGERIATDDVLLWDVPKGKQLLRTKDLYLYHGGSRSLAISHDGKIVAGNENAPRWKLQLWNAETGESILSKEFGNSLPESMAFSPNDKILLVNFGAARGFVDVATGNTLDFLLPEGSVRESIFSPDGNYLAEASGKDVIIRSVTVFPVAVKELLAAGAAATVSSPEKDDVPPPKIKPEPMPQADEFRIWTSADGKFTVEAKLVGTRGDKVSLKRKTGGVIEVSKAHLSAEDVEFLKGK